MEKYNLFLDDERQPFDGYVLEQFPEHEDKSWIVVRNFKEFKDVIIKNGVPNLISFDHDLMDFDHGREFTGYDCAKWLVEFCYNERVDFPHYTVHSANLGGKEYIISYIENAKKHLL